MFLSIKSYLRVRIALAGVMAVIFAFAPLFSIQTAKAAIPQTINYQSRLLTPGGLPVTSTTAIQLSFYLHPTNGAPGDAPAQAGPLVWKEVYDQGSGACSMITPDAKGYFFLKLGSCTPFPAYLDFSEVMYVGVKIGADAEALPRVQLSSHPYALNAYRLNGFEATTTATANQLLALDSNLDFNIDTGSFTGAGLFINGTSTLQEITFTVATGTSLNLTQYLAIGAIRLDATGTNNQTSGAYLVGVFDEFTNSNATTVQGALFDLDTAITTVSSTLYAMDLQRVTDNGATTTNRIQFAGATSVGDIIPGAHDTYTLGNSDLRWAELWSGIVHVGTSTWDLAQADNGAFTISGNAGSERMRILADGKVGIGLRAPEQMLSVRDTLLVGQYEGIIPPAGKSANLILRATDGFSPGIQGSAYTYFQRDANDIARFGITPNNSINLDHWDGLAWLSRMVISSIGFVGVGTNAPSTLLHVQGGLNGRAVLTLDSDDGNNDGQDAGISINSDYAFGSDAAFIEFANNGIQSGKMYSSPVDMGFMVAAGNEYRVYMGGDERFMITSTGNIGLSTSTPAYRLDVAGDSRLTGQFMLGRYASLPVSGHQAGSLVYKTPSSTINYWDGTQWRTVATAEDVRSSLWDEDHDTGVQVEESADEDYIRFDTAGVERMYIQDDGFVGIGTDNPLVSLLMVGPGSHEASSFSVAGISGMLNIANFRDENGENVFRAGGSVAGNDLVVGFGDLDYGGIGTSMQVNYGANAIELSHSDLRFMDVSGGEYVGFIAPAVLATNTIWTLPGADGTNNQVLVTNGAGILSWATSTDLVENIYTADGYLAGDRIVNGIGRGLNVSTTNGGFFDADIRDGSDLGFVHVRSDEVEMNVANPSSYSGLVFNSGGVSFTHNGSGSTTQFYIGSNMMLTDNMNLRGIEYAADYSANYTNRTLVDKEYVDNLVASTSGNIYTQDGTLMANRTVDGDGYGLSFTNMPYLSAFATYYYVDTSAGTWLEMDNDQMSLAAAAGRFVLNGTQGLWQDDRIAGNQHGVEYAADYSADYTNRSLVDKEYVDNAITSSTVSAGNGLTLNSGVMKLGGTLSETTYIDHNGYDLVVREFAGEPETLFAGDNFKIQDGSYEVRFGIGGTTSVGLTLENPSSTFSMFTFDDYVSVTSSRSDFLGLVYDKDYSNYFVDRSLVDKDYVDSHVGALTFQDVADNTITANGYIYYNTGAAFWEDDGGAMKIEARAGGYQVALAEEGGSSLYFKSDNGPGNPTEIKYRDGRALGDRHGIEYDADYSADFTDRSLVDKAYVDNYLSASAGSGLTWDALNNEIDLGGALTGNASINYGGWDFKIEQGNSYQLYNTTNYVTYVSDGVDYTTLLQNKDNLQISGSAGFVGATYEFDYSANFTPRSLVDKEYVDDSIIANAPTIYTADGILTGDRILDGNFNSLTMSNLSGFYPTVVNGNEMTNITMDSDVLSLQSQDIGAGTSASLGLNLSSLDFSIYDGANNNGISLSPTQILIADGINNRGAEYSADYSANYTDRSLVDKEYVDNAIISSSSTLLFANGLVNASSTVELGGAMTKNTDIALDTYRLQFNATDGYHRIADDRTEFSYGYSYFTAEDVGFEVEAADENETVNYYMRNNLFEISGYTSTSAINPNFHGATYGDDYSAYFVDRSLVDKEYVDNANHWQKNTNVLSPTDSAVYQIGIINNSASTLTGFKAVNTNDASNYAGAVLELKGSGADYTNNLYFGKYGTNFYVPSWAGNGVLATDKNLVIGSVGTGTLIRFQVGGGYTAPTSRMTLDTDSLDLLAGVSLNVGGNTVLGDAISDTITFTARAVTSLLPATTNAYALGSTTNRWSDLWAGTVHVGTSTWDLAQAANGALTIGQNGGSERMRVTTDGYVAIGTTTASDWLTVYGSQNFASKGITIENNPTIAGASALFLRRNGYNALLSYTGPGQQLDVSTQGGSGSPISISANGNGGLYISSSGDVGVGLVPSGFKMQIAGHTGPTANNSYDLGSEAMSWRNIYASGTIYGNVVGYINPGYTEGSVIFQGASSLQQDNANFHWDEANNRLLLGSNATTTATGRKLDVNSAVSAGQSLVYLRNANGGGGGRTLHVRTEAGNSNEAVLIDNRGTGAGLSILNGGAGNVYGLLVDSGRVGFGTSTPAFNLDLVGDARVSAQLMLGQYALNPVSGNQAGAMIYNMASSTPFFWDGSEWIALAGSGAEAGSLWDADHDTGIQVEESTDEDIIRFDTAGTEYFTMQGPRLSVLNSGLSVFMGQNAGRIDDLTSNRNVFIGYNAGYSNTSGFNNVYIGEHAGYSATTQESTVAIGQEAGRNNTGAFGNTMLGYYAGRSNTGNDNVMIGYESGVENTGSDNFFMGRGTGWYNTGNNNVMMGYFTGYDNKGAENIIFGVNAGGNNKGSYGVFMGNGTGFNNIGNDNIFMGYEAGRANATGTRNLFLGRQAGYSNILGNGNIFLGYQAGYNETNSDRLYIDNSNTATPLVYGEFDTNVLRINGALQINNPSSTGYALPTTDGNSGQILITNGAGNVSWVSSSALGTDTLQDVTDRGATTTNWIQFAGASSTGDILPGTHDTYGLGSTDYRWSDLWAANVHIGTSTWNLAQADSGAFTISDSGNSEMMRITSDGYVGIGTETPEELLSLNDDVLIGQFDGAILPMGGYNRQLIIRATDGQLAGTQGTAYTTYQRNGIDYARVGLDTSNNINFGHYDGSWSDQVVISTSGNMGIGVFAPSRKLQVQGSTTPGDNLFRIGGGANGAYLSMYASTTDDRNMVIEFQRNLQFYSQANAVISLNNDGSVGFGTDSIDARINAEQSAGIVASFNRTNDDGTIVSLRQDGVEEGTISVSANTISYNAFTGSHYAWTDETMEKGLLVTLTGENRYLNGNTASEIIYGVTKSSAVNDSKVIGAYLSLQEPSKSHSNKNPHLIMAVGNGEVWVADKGENINIGDYLISSDVAGHAEKDASEFMISHIVARAAESVDWTQVTDSIDGVKHRKISVFFEVFDKNNMQGSLAGTSLQGGENNVEADELVVAETVFEGNVTVKNHVTFSEDTVGQAMILVGDKRASIKFAQEYATLPIITVTPANKVTTPYWVENASVTGFDIVLDNVQYADLVFNWHAFGNNGGKVYVSNGTTMEILVNDMGASELETDLTASGQVNEAPEEIIEDEAVTEEVQIEVVEEVVVEESTSEVTEEVVEEVVEETQNETEVVESIANEEEVAIEIE